MSRKTTKAKMGRPRLPPEKRKRPSMGFRPTPELRGKLENAAATSGLSLTQEVERRLERSFSDSDARLQGFGSDERLELLRALSLAVDLVEMLMGKDIFTDAETAEVGYKVMTGLLDGIFGARPGGPLDTVTPTEGQEAIIRDPLARSLDKNIRDAILEGLLPQIPGAEAAFRKKRKR